MDFTPNIIGRLAVTLLIAPLLSACSAGSGKGTVVEGPTDWPTRFLNNERSGIRGEATIVIPPGGLWRKSIGEFDLIKTLNDEVLSSPVISGGLIFGASPRGIVSAVDLESGDTVWRFDTGGSIDGTPTVSKGHLYIGNAEGVLYSIDRSTGEAAWSFRTLSEINSSPLLDGDKLYFTSSDGRLYCLKAEGEGEGTKVWSYTRSTVKRSTMKLTGSPSGDENKIYNLFSDGTLVALDKSTGKAIWENNIVKDFKRGTTRHRTTPLIMEGKVYTTDGSGDIVILSTISGREVGRISSLKAEDFVGAGGILYIVSEDKVYGISVDASASGAGGGSSEGGSVIWESELPTPFVDERGAKGIFGGKEAVYVLSNTEVSTFLPLDLYRKDRGLLRALDSATGELLWEHNLGSTISSSGALGSSHLGLLDDRGRLTLFYSK